MSREPICVDLFTIMYIQGIIDKCTNICVFDFLYFFDRMFVVVFLTFIESPCTCIICIYGPRSCQFITSKTQLGIRRRVAQKQLTQETDNTLKVPLIINDK